MHRTEWMRNRDFTCRPGKNALENKHLRYSLLPGVDGTASLFLTPDRCTLLNPNGIWRLIIIGRASDANTSWIMKKTSQRQLNFIPFIFFVSLLTTHFPRLSIK
jgi:hypothetical protein